ncbi:MAG: glycosyltransferase [Candidatus Edwardsbacteria bacterium]|nr:glycosyltransferase [Candidatus Edwardsbacteria bacterium]MBU1577012.1 glycosyltransferase [Candidatus Edwardsbacteria bacterium]MBU2464570.1 glycosyltransferase [Candidatus Edwardsbacteria bacterium]MBU2593433.1 glycosyltransferase [Candidatus Edwardsbacteria bacterium]
MSDNGKSKILFFDHSPIMSGAEYSLLDILQGLKNKPMDYCLLTIQGSKLIKKTNDIGIETIEISLPERLLYINKNDFQKQPSRMIQSVGSIIKAVIEIYNILRRGKYDAIYTNTLKSHILGGLAGRLAGAKVIWHMRDIPIQPRPKRAIQFASTFIPDKIIAVSEAVGKQFGGRKVSVIHNGIDAEAIQKKAVQEMPVEIQRIMESSSGGPAIGIVGQIARWKGQDVFLRAAKLLAEKLPQAKFLIIGEALFDEKDFRLELNNFVGNNNLQKRVIFTGHLENVYPVLKQLDVLVHCSVEPEPFGRVIIEAMALGVPVIATKGGAVEEIITNGESGLIVPPGDHHQLVGAVERILADRPLRNRIINSSTIKVQKVFGLKEMLDKIDGLIRQLSLK